MEASSRIQENNVAFTASNQHCCSGKRRTARIGCCGTEASAAPKLPARLRSLELARDTEARRQIVNSPSRRLPRSAFGPAGQLSDAWLACTATPGLVRVE